MKSNTESFMSPIEKARSFLFVPGHQPTRFWKAINSQADAVIVDLEDAVPSNAKADARNVLLTQWSALPAGERARLLVRINPVTTSWHRDDVELLQQLPGLGAVMLPKAESEQQLLTLRDAGFAVKILPLIETAEGIAQADEIARSPDVVRLGMGNLDLQADLGMSVGPDGAELMPARWALVLASRRARLVPPVDGVTTSTTEESTWLNDTLASRRLGFGAKLCIHPVQITGIHLGFAPTPSELVWAQKVLKAENASDGGAFSVDGKMIDPPIVQLARKTMDRYQVS